MSDRLHVVSLPHTQTNGEFATCAYTEKVRKFCKMMTGRDREVILYSGEHNTAPCDEHVPLLTEERRQSWFGPHDLGSLERGGFNWEPSSPWWVEMNSRAIGEIRRRAEDQDLLCLIAGRSQQLIAEAIPQLTVAEFGVGYEGIILDRKGGPAFCAFESHSHRHFVYGIKGWRRGREYDAVIPNYFDPDELPYGEGGDYLLFVGRLIEQKGIDTAVRIAKALDRDLIVAGPGATEWSEGWIKFPEGEVEYARMSYVGAVGIEDRAQLMGGANVLLAPTIYLEPFGGVAVEAMMCGTPVVATDYGAFTETVREGVGGFRFQTLQEAVDATERAADLDRRLVRWQGMQYCLDAVVPMYERWFDNLDGLWEEGWTALRDREPAGIAANMTP